METPLARTARLCQTKTKSQGCAPTVPRTSTLLTGPGQSTSTMGKYSDRSYDMDLVATNRDAVEDTASGNATARRMPRKTLESMVRGAWTGDLEGAWLLLALRFNLISTREKTATRRRIRHSLASKGLLWATTLLLMMAHQGLFEAASCCYTYKFYPAMETKHVEAPPRMTLGKSARLVAL